MEVFEYFPVWDKLTSEQQNTLSRSALRRSVKAGSLIYGGEKECLGLLLVSSGRLRAYIFSEDGREITLYRLVERDICLFSASCMINSIQFAISIEAEKDTEFWLIPPDMYKKVMEDSAPLSNYTNQVMADRFSEVMWLIEQIMWKSVDRRLAGFLLEESALEESRMLMITHEKIANHMGTAREVVTRMLKYFQNEGLVALSRGKIEILDEKRLTEYAGK
ncbi:MAG TPA: Crp/Fnr family transcriptional regulator [Candidatus Mediterraneibacter avicola]|nr:Crp/Fnr family transcriptional regulator [Candidatus Mediterraneibacter avicola]